MSREKSKAAARESDELRPYYDFSKAMPNKYAERYAAGTNVVLLDPDVVRHFPNSRAVNKALRSLAEIIKSAAKNAAV